MNGLSDKVIEATERPVSYKKEIAGDKSSQNSQDTELNNSKKDIEAAAKLPAPYDTEITEGKKSNEDSELADAKSDQGNNNDDGDNDENNKNNNNARENQNVTFSVFSLSKKRFIVFMASWAGFFSPVSSQIYYPALNSLTKDLSVSITLVNLTLTSYMVNYIHFLSPGLSIYIHPR